MQTEINGLRVEYTISEDRDISQLKIELQYLTGKLDKYDEPDWEWGTFTKAEAQNYDFDLRYIADRFENDGEEVEYIDDIFDIVEEEVKDIVDYLFVNDLQKYYYKKAVRANQKPTSGNGKYTKQGFLKLRLADHTPNAERNITENETLDVLILRNDPTKEKFGRNYFVDYEVLDIRNVMSLNKATNLIDDAIQQFHESLFEKAMKKDSIALSILETSDDTLDLEKILDPYLSQRKIDMLSDKLIKLGILKEDCLHSPAGLQERNNTYLQQYDADIVRSSDSVFVRNHRSITLKKDMRLPDSDIILEAGDIVTVLNEWFDKRVASYHISFDTEFEKVEKGIRYQAENLALWCLGKIEKTIKVGRGSNLTLKYRSHVGYGKMGSGGKRGEISFTAVIYVDTDIVGGAFLKTGDAKKNADQDLYYMDPELKKWRLRADKIRREIDKVKDKVYVEYDARGHIRIVVHVVRDI